MIADYVTLAVKAITQRKLRSYLTMIGVFIGIAAVVSLVSMGEGLRVAIMAQFGSFGPDVLSVRAGGLNFGPPGTGAINPLTTDDLKKVESVAGVKMAIARLVRSVKVGFNDAEQIGMAASMPKGAARKEVERILGLEMGEGRALKDGDRNRVVLGANYAKDDKFGKPIKPGQKITVQGKEFEVAGILKKKGSFVFDNIILINEDVMRDLFNDRKKVDIIAVIVENQQEINIVQERIEKVMRRARGVKEGEEDFEVESPLTTLKTIDDTMFAVQLFIYIIAGISLLVGGIGISNTMFTAVLERTRDIGIMKAVGAKNSTIFVLFLIESGFMGVVGGIIGVVLGAGLAAGFAAAGSAALGSSLIKAHFPLWLIFGSMLFSFVLGSAAGITPAMNAAKLQPVEAVRYAK